jgi:endonuclease III
VSESRLERHVEALHTFYGAVPPPPRDPFTLFVWEIMSGHSTPRKRDLALAALKKIPALTPDAMWRAPQKKLETAVAAAGPYTEQRLMALRKGVDHFRRAPDLAKTIRGPLAPARRAIKGLPQMGGDGGAYRMLLFAADHVVLPVDARLSRVARRLGYGGGDDHTAWAAQARAIRQAIGRDLPADVAVYRRASLYLSHHGGATCTEAAPHCRVCPLRGECPFNLKSEI